MTSTVPRLLMFALLTLPTQAWSLPEDADQPIEIQADRAELDDQAGVAVYSGDVTMDQGTMRVTADTLTIRTEDGDVTSITAEGDRASYRQVPEPGAPQVEATAGTITYIPAEDRVELHGDAFLEQDADSFRGERIVYDIRARRVAASAGASGDPIMMRIQPSRLRPENVERAD